MKNIKRRLLLIILVLLVSAGATLAQTTAFTYQGRLTDGGTPANGNYDLQFALWDSLAGGTQIGSTQTISTVAVSSGIFTVRLDFGANAFPGANRFLEISSRLSGAGSFTLLSPRQQITSIPYAVRSLSASSADTVVVNGVPAGSGNYIQNTTSQQAADFNISGSGTVGGRLSANDVNVTTVYRIGTFSVLSIPGSGNVFAGPRAGEANTSGDSNSFFGNLAGFLNESGGSNSFFGSTAGRNNKTGASNSFFGTNAGFSNTGSTNSFFGSSAGLNNTAGGNNSFFGSFAGNNNTTGGSNSFFGGNAGSSNTIENDNTFLGASSNGAAGITNATAIGAGASVTQSNSVVLGSNASVGIGTTAPQDKLDVNGIIRVSTLGAAGATSLCRNALNQIATCSSSLRYKTDLHSFSGGLKVINRLHPITFRWKTDRTLDVGLGAEDVAAVEPLLVTHNASGQVEGVKYDRLSAVFINAFNEQQAQIERQQAEAKEQRKQIAALQAANAALNARLQSVEKILKKNASGRRRR